MKNYIEDEQIAHAINSITEKMSKVLLDEFLKLPKEVQINLVLIKATQLLLANILCQVAHDIEEFKKLIEDQGLEIKELAINCAYSGFSGKFNVNKH